jgi:hypothetical protein
MKKLFFSCLIPSMLLFAAHEPAPQGYAGYFGEQLSSHYFHPHYHWAVSFSDTNKTITIEDGSVWQVSSGYYYLSDWKANDPISLKSSGGFYKMENHADRTYSEVSVTILDGPKIGGKYARQIMSIDSAKKLITLTDRSRWNLSYIPANWVTGDYIVVATKYGYYDSVLLNVDLKEETPAKLRKWIYGELN